MADCFYGWQVRDSSGNTSAYSYAGKKRRHFSKMVAEGLAIARNGEAPAADAGGLPSVGAAAQPASPRSVTRGDTSFPAPGGDVVTLVLDGQKTFLVPKRIPRPGEIAIVDWSSMVFSVPEEPEENFAKWASDEFEIITGNAIESKRKNGLNGYRESWQLANGGGKICWGGNAGTAQLVMDGHACAVAHPGWEVRLHDWMVRGRGGDSSAHLTRIDVAFDDFDGQFPLSFWDSLYPQGFLFSGGGKRPRRQQLGDWGGDDPRGRTEQIGSRESGKVARIYEKGRQLGDPLSPWVRVEVEFSSKAFQLLPRDLLHPSALLLGAYPCFSVLGEAEESRRLERIERATQIQLERAFDILRTQYGRYLHVFREMLGDKDCLDRLCVTDRWPEKLERLADLADAAARIRHLSSLPAVARQG